ncbi:restriction endonuclease subunit S [Staphylococcus arlettae]|uniref:restriction endonuclease subunit S n=1 Tax=Staphylococcus arlettae TaxID=29378 RepID=UPI0021D3BC9A|nr:restriction endonuclease subunit S [Staphylococcus arlettae]UXU49993.1 restriction endonuclease subunit S [Staphylococcus arlettae]
MTNDVKNVPEWRFAGFVDEWEKKLLNEIANVQMGQSPNSKNYTDDSQEMILVQGNADLKNGKVFPRVFTKEITKLANIGDILLSVRAPVGEIGISQMPVCIGRGVCSITSNLFIYYFLDYFNNENKWKKFSQGSTFESISGNEVRSLIIYSPSKTEQQKIGDFFSKLDRQIELEEQKLEKLEEQKKGYMQQIFSQKICFKDDNGNDYPEWESKKFLDIFKLAPSKNNQIKSSEVVENGIIPVVDQGKDIFLGYSNEKDKAIEDFNNVIVYGDHTTIIKYIKEPFIIGGDGVKLLESNDGSLIHYLYILLQYFNVKPEGYKRHYSILKNKMMNISNTKEEQEKIGNFFTKFDELIEKQSSKIGVLKQRKKGFLQKMFV